MPFSSRAPALAIPGPPPRLHARSAPPPRPAAARRPAASGAAMQALPWILFLGLHIPLVMAVKASPMLATAHALVVFAAGFQCVAGFRTPERAVYMMGYVVASEPLWRVGKAFVFHESGKYALAAIALLTLIRFRLMRRADRTALVYFLLLLPSLLLLPDFDRREISFNLSGPFALAATTLVMSALPLSPRVLQRLLLVTLGPIVGFVFVATFSTVTATEDIDFFQSKIAAGGLGNNQASSIFGLGTLLAFLFVCIARGSRPLRWLVAGVGVWCGIQGALTFSRGGIATAAGAMAAASFFLLQDRRSRGFLVLRIALIAAIVTFFAIPLLNTVTTGRFEQRFTNSHLTGRDKIIQADMIAFRENTLFGVGPGESKDYHARTLITRASTHTEYSRLLAEHGLFGLTALLLLVWMAFRRMIRRGPPQGKALAASFTVWALLFMFHAAMRMAAASFTFGLGAALLMAEPRPASVRRRLRAPPPRPVLRAVPGAGVQ
jgi:O-antigen ligase